MRNVPLIAALVALTLGGTSSAAVAKTNACRSDPRAGYALRVALAGCATAKTVQSKYFNSGSRTVHAGGRTWRCSARTIKNYGYDPAIFGDRITGRVLCTHIANRGRFVRWYFDGGGD